MEPSKIIKLPVFGIVVTLYPNGSGAVTSDLEPPFSEENPIQTMEDARKDAAYDEGIGVLYAMIQSHATAGIDITDPGYVQGVKNAVESFLENQGSF